MKLPKLLASFCLIGLVATTLFAQPAVKPNASQSGGMVIGRVLARGKPLAGATITLWQQPLAEPSDNTVAARGITNDAGEFELRDIPPGNYYLSARATGFVTGKENQVFANLRFVNAVGSGRTERVDFELVPEGVIRGVVTDAEGKPIARIPINIFAELDPPDSGPPKYAQDLRTDEQGQYKVIGLPAGKYRVAAGYLSVAAVTIAGRPGYRRTFFGGGEDETQARAIDITPGLELTDVNINVGAPVKTFSVKVKFIDVETGKGIADLRCALETYSNGERIAAAGIRTVSNDQGHLTIENVPAGEYSIRTPSGSGIVHKGEVPPTPNVFGESKRFEVTDKDTVVEVPITRAATVSGLLVVEGPAPADVLASVPRMVLHGMILMAPITQGTIKPDGSFAFRGLKPGKLRFNFSSPLGERPLPLRFVGFERDGVRSAEDIELRSGDQITGIRLILAYASSSVNGVVNLNGGPLPPGITGVASLLQKGKVLFGIRGDLSERGEFLLQNVPAGEYTLAVSARDTSNRYWRTEQPITIANDQVAEAIVVLKP